MWSLFFIILGTCLLVAGYFLPNRPPSNNILGVTGCICFVLGLLLLVLDTAGHPVLDTVKTPVTTTTTPPPG